MQIFSAHTYSNLSQLSEYYGQILIIVQKHKINEHIVLELSYVYVTKEQTISPATITQIFHQSQNINNSHDVMSNSAHHGKI